MTATVPADPRSKIARIAALPLLLAAFTGFAGPCQVHDHGAPASSSAAKARPAPTASAADPHAGHDMSKMPAADPHAGHDMSKMPAADPHAGHDMSKMSGRGPTPAGYSHVMLDAVPFPELGFSTAKVERRPLSRRVRTTGWVTVDETQTSHVHAKVRGVVVASHGRFVGSSVKKGEALVSLYSEGILAAELELLSLVQQRQALEAAAPGGAVGQALDPVVEAARKRFALWDVSAGQVAKVEKTGKPARGVTLTAPRDGVILARGAIDGMYVEQATDLFVISDVSKLWIVFDVFERDMPYVAIGQEATFRCEGMTHAHDAKVSYLSPTIDPATRSLRARASVDNQAGTLRPGAFSSVELKIDLGEGLAIPEDALLRTGERDLVYMVHDGMAMAVEVKATPGADGFVRIDEGLLEGDVVVTGAQFFVDSESRLGRSGTGHVH
ncbi:MAG: efflux RND transporter periplasmic adaptor subunit [Polyangiaceae bacterium]|nr:efflux RND transporter periplasmic adaptor subunit [Polyangiaceae bacterium]